MLFFKPDNGAYRDSISKSQLMVSLGAPIMEELIFRGAILQLLLLLIGLAFPPMLLFPCLNLGISVAAAAAICITAGLFGVAHAGNGKNNHVQVVTTFIMGLAFGFFAVQFGLLVAIGAHILNNTIASALGNLFSSPATKKEEKVVESLENNFSELKMA